MAAKHVLFLCPILMFYSALNTLAQQQISNGGFEFWEEIRSGVDEPVKWNSIKNTDGSMATKKLAPDVMYRSEMAHSGKYAVGLVNKSTLGIVANGLATNVAIHGEKNKDKSYVYTDEANGEFSTPFISKPDSIVGWYIYTPRENDSALVVLMLHKGKVTLPDHGTKNNWVGFTKLLLPATAGKTWTRFSAPVTYVKKNDTPQYMIIVLSAGNRKNAVAGSEAFFDDLQFVYNKK